MKERGSFQVSTMEERTVLGSSSLAASLTSRYPQSRAALWKPQPFKIILILLGGPQNWIRTKLEAEEQLDLITLKYMGAPGKQLGCMASPRTMELKTDNHAPSIYSAAKEIQSAPTLRGQLGQWISWQSRFRQNKGKVYLGQWTHHW